jgi:hypothetical protein
MAWVAMQVFHFKDAGDFEMLSEGDGLKVRSPAVAQVV